MKKTVINELTHSGCSCLNSCFVCTQRAADDGWPCRITVNEEQDLTLASASVGPLKPTEWPIVSNLDLVVSTKTYGMQKKEVTSIQEKALGLVISRY